MHDSRKELMKRLHEILLNRINRIQSYLDSNQLDVSKENRCFSNTFGMVLVKDHNFLLGEYTEVVWMAQMERQARVLLNYLHFKPNIWDKMKRRSTKEHSNVDNTMTNLTSSKSSIRRQTSIREDRFLKFHKTLRYVLVGQYWI